MKQFVFYLLLAGLFVLSCERDKEDPVINQMSQVRGYKNWFIGDFRCGLFVPASYDLNKKYPLIIRLHGFTDTTSWVLPWYKEPIVSDDPCIVLTPKCPKEDPYGWGNSSDPRTSPMMSKTYEMIELVKQAFNLDEDRYYIYGSSMGGSGTYGVLKKNPDMFAAAYVECGYPTIDMAAVISKIPFWMFHGSEDPTVPVQPTRDLYAAVVNLGGTQIRYTEYQGVGHNVWDYTDKETTITSWLIAQRKGSLHATPQPISNFTGQFTIGKTILNWEIPSPSSTSQDNRVWFCRIYRNGNVFKEVYNNNAQFIDSTASKGDDYNYKITAVNYYFKESLPSNTVTVNALK